MYHSRTKHKDTTDAPFVVLQDDHPGADQSSNRDIHSHLKHAQAEAGDNKYAGGSRAGARCRAARAGARGRRSGGDSTSARATSLVNDVPTISRCSTRLCPSGAVEVARIRVLRVVPALILEKGIEGPGNPLCRIAHGVSPVIPRGAVGENAATIIPVVRVAEIIEVRRDILLTDVVLGRAVETLDHARADGVVRRWRKPLTCAPCGILSRASLSLIGR